MTENDRLRGLEIRFYLIMCSLEQITKPPNTQNIFAFLEFINKIDFTNSINCDILKTLVTKIRTTNTNIQPNKIELCNFIHSHNLPLNCLNKFIKIDSGIYHGIVNRINEETFFQPTHLQPEVYNTIENFLKKVNELQILGVEKTYARINKRK